MKWLLPDVVFHMRERDESVGGDNPFKWVRKTTAELFEGKKVVIFGLPGAFTPTCSNSQLPGYEELYDQFGKLGVRMFDSYLMGMVSLLIVSACLWINLI